MDSRRPLSPRASTHPARPCHPLAAAATAAAAADVFEAIEISTYPSSATKCEEFSIRVPGLPPSLPHPLFRNHLAPRPSISPASVPPPPVAATSTNFFNSNPPRTRGKRKDDNTDVSGGD